MSEYPKATRYYIIGGIFGIIQTVLAFTVNEIIGIVAIILTGFMFLGALFAHRGTMGWYTPPAGQEHLRGDFTSGICGLMLGPMTIVAILITVFIPVGGSTWPNLLYIVPAILAGIFTTVAGVQVIMKM